MPNRSFVLSIAALTIGLGVALLLAEITLRVTGLGSPLNYLPNPLYGWSNTPNSKFSSVIEDHTVDIAINSLGLRDAEYPYAKAPGVHRTLVLGDSFAEALQVQLQDSFPKLIEKRLNGSRHGERPGYEVINAGTSGYGTDNELLFLRHEGYKYSPDVIILAFYIGNDVRNNWYPLENIDAGGFRKPYFTREGTSVRINAFPFEQHATLLSQVKVFFNQNLRLYSYVREIRDRLRNRKLVEHDRGRDSGEEIRLDTYLFESEYAGEWETAWQVTKGLILELQTEVQDKGAELLVIVIPTQFQVHERYWDELAEHTPAMRDMTWDLDKPNKILKRFLDKNGIAYIDLLPEFRRRAAYSGLEYYFRRDNHWNDTGHQLAAEVVSDYLLSEIASP